MAVTPRDTRTIRAGTETAHPEHGLITRRYHPKHTARPGSACGVTTDGSGRCSLMRFFSAVPRHPLCRRHHRMVYRHLRPCWAGHHLQRRTCRRQILDVRHRCPSNSSYRHGRPIRRYPICGRPIRRCPICDRPIRRSSLNKPSFRPSNNKDSRRRNRHKGRCNSPCRRSSLEHRTACSRSLRILPDSSTRQARSHNHPGIAIRRWPQPSRYE